MNGKPDPDPAQQDWNGLPGVVPSLPSRDYYDAAQHDAEMTRIWQRCWLYGCRADELPAPLSFRTLEVGRQPVLLLRDEHGELRAFYNTCRHRGSVLCREREGRLRAKSLVCPYHAWTYSLQGELRRVPSHGRPSSLATGDYPLYPVAVRVTGGCVFFNLDKDSTDTLDDAFSPPLASLAHWPLAELAVAHSASQVVRCNWKVFWENYNECLHCPGVHPQLASLVPIYRRAIMEERDDPDWRTHSGEDDPLYRGGLRRGAVTWSSDGLAHGPQFSALDDQERRVAYHFVTALPSMYLVAHVDYVRIVRVWPLGPEQTELSAQWLLSREAIADPRTDLDNITGFAARVMAEDAAACELAQRGLHSTPHANGVLMPEEYDVHRFHAWVRSALAR